MFQSMQSPCTDFIRVGDAEEETLKNELSWREVLLAQVINLQNTYVVNDIDKMTIELNLMSRGYSE